MSQLLGKCITAMVIDKNEQDAFVQKDGMTFKVASEDSVHLELGNTLEGFAYVDKDDQYSITTEIPDVRSGNFGWGKVVEVRRDLGIFVDVGWPNKDLVVSIDDLPELRHLWPKANDKLYLTLDVDGKNRMWGKLAEEEEFEKLSKSGTEELHNENMSGYAFLVRKSGTYVYTDSQYVGFVHPSQREREPRLGEYVNGRIIGLREDGVVYLSLLPRAYEVLDEDAAMLLEILKRAEDHMIPFNDKSNPDDIRKQFGISKGQFKRAIGRLMKNRLIKQDEMGTSLVASEEESN